MKSLLEGLCFLEQKRHQIYLLKRFLIVMHRACSVDYVALCCCFFVFLDVSSAVVHSKIISSMKVRVWVIPSLVQFYINLCWIKISMKQHWRPFLQRRGSNRAVWK